MGEEKIENLEMEIEIKTTTTKDSRSICKAIEIQRPLEWSAMLKVTDWQEKFFFKHKRVSVS